MGLNAQKKSKNILAQHICFYLFLFVFISIYFFNLKSQNMKYFFYFFLFVFICSRVALLKVVLGTQKSEIFFFYFFYFIFFIFLFFFIFFIFFYFFYFWTLNPKKNWAEFPLGGPTPFGKKKALFGGNPPEILQLFLSLISLSGIQPPNSGGDPKQICLGIHQKCLSQSIFFW